MKEFEVVNKIYLQKYTYNQVKEEEGKKFTFESQKLAKK